MTRYEELVQQVNTRQDDQCWDWPAHDSGGYSSLQGPNGKTTRAHVIAYELRYGPIPVGTELDHLCMDTGCWNPDHVEPVTHSENLLRGKSLERDKTHCPQGHPYDYLNTLHYNGQRVCRECKNRRSRESYHNNQGKEKVRERRARTLGVVKSDA